MMKNTPVDAQTGGLYTVAETAALLKCSTKQVYIYINAKLLPAMKLGRLKIRPAAIEQFLERWEGYDLSDPLHPIKLDDITDEA